MIRKIQDSDREFIYSILEKVFKVTYYDDTFYTNWYIYEKNNKIIGFINYDVIYEKAEIEYIYVEKKYRNSNIGTELLNEAMNNMKKRDVESVTLEVRSNNQIAINFYKKNGFKKVAIRKRYYKNIDAILMMKSW